MKIGFKYFPFIIAFTILSLANCKKYPDDPATSIRSTKARYSGSWNITYIKVNGIDYTQQYADSMGISNIKDLRIGNSWESGYSRGSKEWRSAYWYNKNNIITNRPDIDEKSETIWYDITFIGNFSGAPLERLYKNGCSAWKILRLYKGKMIIRTETGPISYEICYDKTK